jgi:thymidylate synthase ThyX
MSDSKKSNDSTQVYAVYGVEPEVQAYAMAKYSRSALSLKETLAEISEQRAEKFLNTFYFQYGHRSIADLAHIAMAVERLSLLAAIVLEDEQRWDGQERSTRYQDFSHPNYYVPDFDDAPVVRKLYCAAIDFLFSEYRFFSEEMFHHLADRTPRPGDMKEDSYERTLRARAFDIARYLLPLATNTSLGQIVNARTLETQIARLLSHPHAEVRALGHKLKEAALTAAYSVREPKLRAAIDQVQDRALADQLYELTLKDVRVAPTLVKYADPSPYLIETRKELAQAARELFKDDPIDNAPEVDLLDDETVEIEIPTSLLYEHCNYPYRQIRRKIVSLSARQREEITALGTKHRGSHDELLRAFCGGQKFRFDILMDVGGFRDLHRHRRCVQLHQDFVFTHGFETPADVVAAGHADRYHQTMQRIGEAAHKIATALSPSDSTVPHVREANVGNSHPVTKSQANEWQYLMPLAYRKRTLFKMDFAEVAYITELRTTAAGHFSYRNIAFKMYEAVAKRHPSLAQHIRVTDVREPVDLLKR